MIFTVGSMRVRPCDLGNKSCISLVLNYLAGILSVDDLYIFECSILASTGTDF